MTTTPLPPPPPKKKNNNKACLMVRSEFVAWVLPVCLFNSTHTPDLVINYHYPAIQTNNVPPNIAAINDNGWLKFPNKPLQRNTKPLDKCANMFSNDKWQINRILTLCKLWAAAQCSVLSWSLLFLRLYKSFLSLSARLPGYLQCKQEQACKSCFNHVLLFYYNHWQHGTVHCWLHKVR